MAKQFGPGRYLPKAKIKKILNQVAKSDLKAAKFEWLKKKMARVQQGLVIGAPIYDSGISLYRARKISCRPEQVSDLSYPPASVVTDYGRANRPQKPMFYLNSLRNAVFFELNPVAGDYLAIGHWELIDKVMMVPVGYSDGVFAEKKSNRRKPEFGPGDSPLLTHPTNKLLEDFIASEFTKEVSKNEPWEFKISAAIAENRLSHPDADGIMYPTVAMRANSDNFALRPSSARKLKIKKAEFVRVDTVREFSFEATVLDTATEFSVGKIKWKGKPKWTLGHPGEELKLVVEEGQWRAYDVDGNLREFD